MTSLDRDAARARIFVLGGFRIVVEGRELRLRTRKEAMLLLRLALAGEGGIRRDELVAMLWPDSSEARARHSLSEALRGIEMATGVELQRSAERIAVASSDVHTDLSDLDEAIDRGDVHELNRLFIGGFLAGWYPPTAEASHWTDAIAAALATRLEKVARAQLASRRKATDSRGVSAVVALLERLGAATAADREAAAEAEQITGWDALRGDESIQSRLPLDREGRFVGREEEMKSLTTELERALAGEMRVVLVSGEAGIGKTRVCQRLARIAALRGARMLLTNCYELEQPIPFAAASGTFASVSSSEISQLNAA